MDSIDHEVEAYKEGCAAIRRMFVKDVGGILHDWFRPYATRPGFFNFQQRQHEREMLKTIHKSLPMFKFTAWNRKLFYIHLDYGKGVNESHEDYLWRCWAAMFGIHWNQPLRQEDVTKAELEPSLQRCPVCKGPAAFFQGGFGEKQARCAAENCNFGLQPDQWQSTWEQAKLAWDNLIERIYAKTE